MKEKAFFSAGPGLLLALASFAGLLSGRLNAQQPSPASRISGGQTRISTRTATSISDTITQADCGKLISYSNAGAITVTLPAPESVASGCWIDVQNTGAGTVTVTPDSSTIDGALNLKLATNQGARIINSATQYLTMRGGAALPPGCSALSEGIYCTNGFVSGDEASSGEMDLFDADGAAFTGIRAPLSIESTYVRILSSTPPAAGQISQFTGLGSGATLGAVTVSSGAVTGISVTSGGSGYGSTPPLVRITGDGSHASAHAVLSSGAVTSIVIDDGGTAYTTANAVLVPVTTESFVTPSSSSSGSAINNATAYPLFGTGDTIDGGGLGIPGAPLYANTFAFSAPPMTFSKLVVPVTSGCSAACGYVFAVFSADMRTTLCKTEVLTDATAGLKTLRFVSGALVSNGVCAFPGGGAILLATSDSGSLQIRTIYGSHYWSVAARALSASYCGFASPAATGISGSGSSIAIPSDLSAVPWAPTGDIPVPFIVVGN